MFLNLLKTMIWEFFCHYIGSYFPMVGKKIPEWAKGFKTLAENFIQSIYL